MQLDGYVRVSRLAGRDTESASYRTEADQRDAITSWADREGHEIIAWHVERDVSGRRMSRPLFDVAMRRIERRETDGLAVAYRSRFGRTMLGTLQAIQRIEAAGGVALAADGFDSTTPEGRLARDVMLRFAEYELERIEANWRSAQGAAVARGVHIGKPPRGYTRTGPPRRNGGAATGPLVPDPAVAPKVTEAYRLRAAGEPWSVVCDLLGISQGVARKMLQSRTYLGEARGPRGLVNPGAHPALVDEDTWHRAQPGAPTGRTQPHEATRLGGLVRCAGCGHAMAAVQSRPRGRPLASYVCRGRHREGRCPAPAGVTARLLDAWVADQVDQALANPAFAGYEQVRAVLEGASARDAAQAELAEAEAELVAFVTTAAALRVDMFTSGVAAREARVAEARRRLGASPADGSAWWAGDERPLTAEEFDAADTRALYRRLIEAVIVARAPDKRSRPVGDRARVVWRG